jgi:hypothetical protein
MELNMLEQKLARVKLAEALDEVTEQVNHYCAMMAEDRLEELKEIQLAGMTIVEAANNTLLIDIDSKEAMDHFWKAWKLLKPWLHLDSPPFNISGSKSYGEHSHITVFLGKDYPPMERMLLQAMLGSDLMREIANYKRTLTGAPSPIAFFEPDPRVIPIRHSELVRRQREAAERGEIYGVTEGIKDPL